MHEAIVFRRVAPARPPAGYIGGKKQLAARLIQLIERVPHITYAEPFVGMGGVFLRRSIAPKAEVINDISGDVTTFFRILQRHYVAFMEMLKFQITSRREFERLSATDPSTLTDLERAARFLYLQRAAYGGKVNGRTFGVSPGHPARFDVTKLAPLLEEVHERLAGVVIERLPYADFIDRYDGPEVLFYLDPPYDGSEDDYGKGVFSRSDFRRLAAHLLSIEGMAIVSLNDTPFVRDAFEGFGVEEVELTYTVNGSAPQPAREVILTTPGLPQVLPELSLFA